jgi:hypothetical protein
MHGRPCYRVAFSDGESITADAAHLWPVRRPGTARHVLRTTLEGASTLIVDTGCYAAAASIDDLCSYSAGLM